MNSTQESKVRIAIAGASGFVGRALRKRLSQRFQIVALTRRPSAQLNGSHDEDGVEWRQCDLFDPDSIRDAIEDVEIVVYLVHSMSPQSRLTQARFDDLDLLLADNMRRAMDACKTKYIVFLGGLGADQKDLKLSRHLDSRREVGVVLGSGNARLTELRAGLVIGTGGSSFRMLVRLIRRLPVMVLPRWTSTPTQPVAIQDIERAFDTVVTDPANWEGEFDLGIAEEMTYGRMILRAAKAMGRRPLTFGVPISSPRVSTLWIMLFSGEPGSLVIPLIGSLKTPTIARDNRLLEHLDRNSFVGFDESVSASFRDGSEKDDPRRVTRRTDKKVIHDRSLVRSIQRMRMPETWTPADAVREYWNWLRRVVRPILKITLDLDEDNVVQRVAIHLRGGLSMLELQRHKESCDPDTEVLRIVKGMLVRKNSPPDSRLEFRVVRECGVLLTAIQEYAPSLPWPIYIVSQAWLHLVVMFGFRRWVRRKI